MKDLFETFDHASIYVFIAGTYTPLVLIALPKMLGWSLFAVIWTLAVAGIVFKAFFTKRFLFMSTILYIAMGWLIVWAWNPLSAAMPGTGLILLVTGGLLYTVGTIFYVWRGFRFII